VIFQDIPGPGIFRKKIQDFPEGVGTLDINAVNSSVCHVTVKRITQQALATIPSISEKTVVFILSTSFCSLSSWFTSSCAYHLITVTTFALITYHCLYLPLRT